MKNKIWILCVAMQFLSLDAFAAKFIEIEKAGRLGQAQVIAQNICEEVLDANYDCYVNSYRILSRKADEKLENTLKQILQSKARGIWESIDVSPLRGGISRVRAAVEHLLDGIDVNRESAETLETLKQDLLITMKTLRPKEVLATLGTADSQSAGINFMAWVDLKSNEVVVVTSGYSE